MMAKFQVVSGRLHITDSKLEEDTHGVNLWDLRVKNGIWIVESPEDSSYVRCSHAVSRSLTDMNEGGETITYPIEGPNSTLIDTFLIGPYSIPCL